MENHSLTLSTRTRQEGAQFANKISLAPMAFGINLSWGDERQLNVSRCRPLALDRVFTVQVWVQPHGWLSRLWSPFRFPKY